MRRKSLLYENWEFIEDEKFSFVFFSEAIGAARESLRSDFDPIFALLNDHYELSRRFMNSIFFPTKSFFSKSIKIGLENQFSVIVISSSFSPSFPISRKYRKFIDLILTWLIVPLGCKIFYRWRWRWRLRFAFVSL